MGSSSKKDGHKDKDKGRKSSKSSKHRSKSSKRRHESDSDSSSESDAGEHKRQKSEKLAQKVASHIEKTAGASTFVWGKKVERELESGKKLKELSIFRTQGREAERLEEIRKVRERQAERETEKTRREEELTMMQRVRAAQEAMESEAKEEEFYLKAKIAKSQRRLEEGRPTPIDLIAKNIHLSDEFEFDLEDPWLHVSGLLLEDMQALHEDILEYKDYDKLTELHSEFWSALATVSEAELNEAKRRDVADRALMRGGAGDGGEPAPALERGLHPDVEEDIEGMLTGQTLGQLAALQNEVVSALEGGDGDPEYWEAVQRRLSVHMAKAQVRDCMSKLFAQYIARMKKAAEEVGAGVDAGVDEEWHPLLAGDSEDAEDAAAAAGPSRRDGSEPGPSTSADADADAMPPPPVPVPGGAAAAAAGGGGAGADAAAGVEIAVDDDDGSDEAAGADAAAGTHAAAAGADADAGVEIAVDNNDGSDEDDNGAEEGLRESDGRWSPPPVDRVLVSGQDIIPEEEDARQLEMLRQQVLLQESVRFKMASTATASVSGPDYGTGIGGGNELKVARAADNPGVHPMFRNMAAFQNDPGFRTGREGTDIGGSEGVDASQLESFKNASMRLMGNDGADRDFGGEVSLESTVYWWHEKYKPRKPKYFNRVHTGYDWNKYNQTHYDSDNPPPKTVQGYKFNILYHDLIDKKKAPEYRVEKDRDCVDDSTCMLRFTAGPPYEDIAFRIVNKEWGYSHKRGFRCTFERGILHLFFNFDRPRYRR
ncbi:hypothetical protein FOA52_015186 [Chlamydomonas sp. UWO 241]|nr:hypothetical protein FOA52_015186 [Chlamydomonas sp. UWO 241]